MKLSKREEWPCYFLYACQFIVSDDTRLSSTFHDMDNRLITMSTAPNNPNLSHPTLVLQRQHHPAAGSAGFKYQGLEESARLLCHHLPIRPHGTKNFFLMTRILRFFQIFQCICFIRRRKLFIAKKKRFRKEMQRAYFRGEGQGRHGHGGTQICLARKILVEPGYLSTC